jgi:hypothetical protein
MQTEHSLDQHITTELADIDSAPAHMRTRIAHYACAHAYISFYIWRGRWPARGRGAGRGARDRGPISMRVVSAIAWRDADLGVGIKEAHARC